jgi:hypothetical protein
VCVGVGRMGERPWHKKIKDLNEKHYLSDVQNPEFRKVNNFIS